MANSHHVVQEVEHFGSQFITGILLSLPFIVALVIYLGAFIISRLRQKTWPISRLNLWLGGVFCALAAISDPIVNCAHMDFTIHMLGHLLLGMLAPLLMVLAAPMTLILQTLSVVHARRLSILLRSRLVRFISNPIIACLLNIGALWILYTSSLYMKIQEHVLLHLVIHIHIFLAGYLFTASIIYIDPTPHRNSFVFRAIVLVTALSGHGILAKYIYAHPPEGVPLAQAKIASMLMYYGGDAIDLVVIIIFCYQWNKVSRPVKRFHQSV